MEKQGDRVTLLIPEFAYCYKCRFSGQLRENDEVELYCSNADPIELLKEAVMRIAAGEGDA